VSYSTQTSIRRGTTVITTLSAFSTGTDDSDMLLHRNLLLLLPQLRLQHIVQYLSPKERIACCLLCKAMRRLIITSGGKHFADVWFSFDIQSMQRQTSDPRALQIKLVNAASLNARYYKNCVHVCLQSVKFVDDDAEDVWTQFDPMVFLDNLDTVRDDDEDDAYDDDAQTNTTATTNNTTVSDTLSPAFNFNAVHTRERSGAAAQSQSPLSPSSTAVSSTASPPQPSPLMQSSGSGSGGSHNRDQLLSPKTKKFVRFKHVYTSSDTGSNRRVYTDSPKQDHNQHKASILSNIQRKRHDPKSNKRISNTLLHRLWIWREIHCLEIAAIADMDEVFNSLQWELLCKHKLSTAVTFLAFDMAHNIMTPDHFCLIAPYFPNLEYLNLTRWQHDDKYNNVILEFFKLRSYHALSSVSWERVENANIKLKGVQFEHVNASCMEMLAQNLSLSYEANTRRIDESLFTQLITLSVSNCQLTSVVHLQLMLNGCINLKYLSLCNIEISDQQIHKVFKQSFESFSTSTSTHHSSTVVDRVERAKSSAIRKKKKSSKKRVLELEMFDNVPVIYIPKTVKYLKVHHKFINPHSDRMADFDESDDGGGIAAAATDEEDDESKSHTRDCSSNHSTPLLFAMDEMDAMRSPSHKRLSRKTSIQQSQTTKQKKKIKKKKVRPLSKPPFYCNLSKCRKKLVEANVVVNDPYLMNQLCAHKMKALKYVILGYSSAQHNLYMNFNDFCGAYMSHFQRWDIHECQHTNIILNNALYDSWRYSLYKAQINKFLETVFGKTESQLLKEEQVPLHSRSTVKHNAFIQKLSKCTDFFQTPVFEV